MRSFRSVSAAKIGRPGSNDVSTYARTAGSNSTRGLSNRNSAASQAPGPPTSAASRTASQGGVASGAGYDRARTSTRDSLTTSNTVCALLKNSHVTRLPK